MPQDRFSADDHPIDSGQIGSSERNFTAAPVFRRWSTLDLQPSLSLTPIQAFAGLAGFDSVSAGVVEFIVRVDSWTAMAWGLGVAYNLSMPRTPAELLSEALHLPIDARAALADSLLDSLDAEVDANAEEAWRDEIYRRLQEIDSGAVQLIPWHDARRRLRASLRQ